MTILIVSPNALIADDVSTYNDAPTLNNKLIPVDTRLIKRHVSCADDDSFVISYAGYEGDFQTIFTAFVTGRPLKKVPENVINVFLHNKTEGVTYTFYIAEGEDVIAVPFVSSTPTIMGDGAVPLIQTASLLEKGVITDSQFYEVMRTLWFSGTSRTAMDFNIKGYHQGEPVEHTDEAALCDFLVDLVRHIGFAV